MAFRSYVSSMALLKVTAKIFFIRDVYLEKIGERAETLRNIHQHMHFLLCILRDKKDVKKFWALNSIGSTNRSRIVSQVWSAMRQISCSFFFPRLFFLLEVLTRLFLDLFRLFVIFSAFFLHWHYHYEIETSLPPQSPPPAFFPFLPISYPWGSFDACLCTQADETQPLIYYI